MKSKQDKQTPEEKVKATLSKILTELNSQLLRSEITTVQTRAQLGSRNTVVSYLSGEVATPTIAHKIINAARIVLKERENALYEQVA